MISWASFSRHLSSIPSLLSLFRGLLALIVPFLFLRPSAAAHMLAIFFFTVGALTDYWDGWVARRYGWVTPLGKVLDPTMDKVLILPPLAIFAWMGFYSPWWVVPIFIREIVVTFCRVGLLLNGEAIGAEALGKWKLGAQVTTIGFAALLLLTADFPAFGFLGGWIQIFLWVSLLGAFLLTLISGVSFLYANRPLFRTPAFCRFVSALGVGLIPAAPGTWGSAVGLVLVLLSHWNIWLYVGVGLALAGAGFWAVSRLQLAEERDPQFVVIDEALGILVTFFVIPLGWPSVLTGFALFRLFDIVKPWPVRRLEKLHGYWGILADDIAAGCYAWFVLWLAFGMFH